MRNKIIFTLVFIIIVAAGIAAMVFLIKRSNLGSIDNTATVSKVELETQSEEKTETPTAESEKEIPHFTVDTDYFVLPLPPGWEMTSEENALPIIVADSEEEVLNEKAEEIGFRTNLSINKTDLGESSFKAYVDMVKASLISNIPIIEIIKEEESAISDKEAYSMEIKSIQQDLKFGTFVVLVAGRENTVWAFSFNTLGESWQKYEDVFYEIIEGLKMK